MNDYHEYVIKSGNFIGQFEEMYKDCNDPWQQSKVANSVSRDFSIQQINKLDAKSIVEFGCGLGYFTNSLKKKTKANVLGVDVSPTAIGKAKHLFPYLNFKIDEVKNIKDYNSDVILFSEIVWYILPDLKEILGQMKGKYFINNLVFYPNGEQKYGNQYFTSLKEFINYVPFELVVSAEFSTGETSSVFKI